MKTDAFRIALIDFLLFQLDLLFQFDLLD